MTHRLFGAALCLLFGLSACLPCCGDTQAGDGVQMTLTPLVRDAELGDYRPITEGEVLPLTVGGQGFSMVVVGARAQNVNTCGPELTAKMFASDTDELLAEASNVRNLAFVDDHTAQTEDEDASQGVWLLACSGPRTWNVPVRVELSVKDSQGKTASATATGVLKCPRYCEPFCQDADAGVDAGQ